MNDKYYITLKNSYGKFILVEDLNGYISGIHANDFKTTNLILKETPLLKELKRQLNLYFQGKLKKFEIPFKQPGTLFEQEVYSVLAEVPFGYTVTYSDIAYLIGKEKASRAVGNALGKNDLLILVPCHRVLGKNSLGGFSSGLKLKKKLLKIEGVKINEKK